MLSTRALLARRHWLVAGIVVAQLFVFSPSLTANASLAGGNWNFNASEACLMRKINNARNRNGLSSLNWDKQLGYVARQHAQRMASSNSLYHDGQLGERVTRWRRIAQNTGYGGKCRRIFRSFMNSSTHRSNIMGAWRFVGVGTEWRNGCLWVQQVFESRDDPGNVYHYP